MRAEGKSSGHRESRPGPLPGLERHPEAGEGESWDAQARARSPPRRPGSLTGKHPCRTRKEEGKKRQELCRRGDGLRGARRAVIDQAQQVLVRPAPFRETPQAARTSWGCSDIRPWCSWPWKPPETPGRASPQRLWRTGVLGCPALDPQRTRELRRARSRAHQDQFDRRPADGCLRSPRSADSLSEQRHPTGATEALRERIGLRQRLIRDFPGRVRQPHRSLDPGFPEFTCCSRRLHEPARPCHPARVSHAENVPQRPGPRPSPPPAARLARARRGTGRSLLGRRPSRKLLPRSAPLSLRRSRSGAAPGRRRRHRSKARQAQGRQAPDRHREHMGSTTTTALLVSVLDNPDVLELQATNKTACSEITAGQALSMTAAGAEGLQGRTAHRRVASVASILKGETSVGRSGARTRPSLLGRAQPMPAPDALPLATPAFVPPSRYPPSVLSATTPAARSRTSTCAPAKNF